MLRNLQGFTLALPIPLDATQILDFAGRWGKERIPQYTEIKIGTHLRENRRGRTGLIQLILCTWEQKGFNFNSGQIWAIHNAWSGNHVTYCEKTYHGDQILGAGELLLSGEVKLKTQESYSTPSIYAAYGIGLDNIANKFHTYMRSTTTPTRPRPITLNVWEAVYFDPNLKNLKKTG